MFAKPKDLKFAKMTEKDLEEYISKLQDEKNKLIMELNEYKREEETQSNDEFEL